MGQIYRSRERGPSLSIASPHLRTHTSEIRWLLNNLIPRCSGYNYLRLGNNGDGGYVLPNDLEGIVSCFSPGVNKQIDFELDLLEKFGVASHLCDESRKRPLIPDVFTFDDFWLADENRVGFSTLCDWVNKYADRDAGDLALQMDIEGAEWQVLASTPDSLLKQFRIVIVEVHTVSKITSWRRFRNEVRPFFSKLLKGHYVAYLHANNSMTSTSVGSLIIPEILEITFHRRDRIREKPRPLHIPTCLDYDSVQDRPSVEFYIGEVQELPG